MEACVLDHTPGFDLPAQVELPPPDSEGGRGLYLIKTLCDHAGYFRGGGENRLELKKKRLVPGVILDGAAAAGLQSRLDESQATLDLMTEELASAYESLSTIFRFSAELSDQLQPEEFARKWLGEVSKIAAADWFILRLFEEGRGLKLVAGSNPQDLGLRDVLSLENAGVADVSVELRAASFRIDVWFDAAHPVPEADPLFTLAGRGGGFSRPSSSTTGCSGS